MSELFITYNTTQNNINSTIERLKGEDLSKSKIIAYFVIVLIVLILAILFGNLLKIIRMGTLFIYNGTSSHSSNSSRHLQQNNTSTSIKPKDILPQYILNCSNLFIYEQAYNHTTIDKCGWNGGKIGIWIASGNSTNVRISVKGDTDAHIYINQLVNYGCMTFLTALDLPKQNYTITFNTYGNKTNCYNPTEKLKLNTTVSPSFNKIYNFVYNGGFTYGTYVGWALDTDAFGMYPSNILKVNKNLCFKSYPWTNLNGTYFATTANCYHTIKTGNLTSSYFYAAKLFLDFQIVSPTNSTDYIEILHDNHPVIVTSYNTYYLSTDNDLYRFENASIPLISVRNESIRVKIISSIKGIQPTNKVRERPLSNFIAISDIHLSNIPWQYKNITSSISIR